MKRLAWVTDIHLDHAQAEQVDVFCKQLRKEQIDGLLITGDIAEAYSLESYLQTLKNQLFSPIYFVLGNHDFYRGSIEMVRKNIAELTEQYKSLFWMSNSGVIELTPQTCLIGHDSWADGRFGDYESSEVIMSDYMIIKEFALPKTEKIRGTEKNFSISNLKLLTLLNRLGTEIHPSIKENLRLGKPHWLTLLNHLGDEAADHFRQWLPQALERYPQVIVLTHVPPFKESCWHEGKISGEDWLPHFSCKAVGDVLREMMSQYPDREMLVLCGHTHSSGEVRILPNLTVKTGAAVYGTPQIQEILSVH